MSFASEVKEDLIKVYPKEKNEKCCELEAMLRFGAEVMILPTRIEFTCNQTNIMRKFLRLCGEVTKVSYEIKSRIISRFDNHTVYTCTISEGAEDLVREFNLIGSASPLRESEQTEGMMSSYLRGAFLVRGSVNDPKSKDSHLELSSPLENEILYVQKLMNNFELNARIIKRKSYLVAYIKSHESIGDFLYRIGATSVMNYYNDQIITKEIRATASRSVNLDIANQDKTNEAARDQLRYIRYLEYNYPLDKLDNKLLMVMKVRKENPEHSLSQLLDIIHEEYDPSLSKSGLNHRLRKLKELAILYSNGEIK